MCFFFFAKVEKEAVALVLQVQHKVLLQHWRQWTVQSQSRDVKVQEHKA